MHYLKERVGLLIALLFSLLILANNLVGLEFNCLNAQDFAIYQQGIYEFSFSDFNPYRTVRDIPVFNDHVNPILFLVAPISFIFNHNPIVLIIFEWMTFILGLFLIWKWSSKESRNWLILFAIFSKGLLSGLEFPIHPGVWSFPVWLWWIRSYLLNSTKQFILSSLTLCLFRETYPFVILPLSALLLLNRDKEKGIPTLVIGLIFGIFIFVIRPYLVGETKGYASAVFDGFSDAPLKFVWNKITTFHYKVPFKLFYPFVLPLVIILKDKSTRRSTLILCLAFIPLAGVHFLANSFYFQYPVAFVAPLLGIILFYSSKFAQLETKKLAFMLILFIASSSSVYTKMVKRVFLSKDSKCSISQQKLKDSEELMKIIDKIPIEKKILSTSGIIPKVLRPGMKIYQIRQFSKIQERYDYLLLERNKSGDITPLREHEVTAIEQTCQSFGRVLLKNESYLLVEGDIPAKCAK